MGWIGGTIVIGATIVLLILDENALEKWCNKCCFSLNKDTKRFKNDEDELTDFFLAAQEVL
jgi:hypothetical protein